VNKKMLISILALAAFVSVSGCITPPVCGDGICNGNETPESCPQECIPPVTIVCSSNDPAKMPVSYEITPEPKANQPEFAKIGFANLTGDDITVTDCDTPEPTGAFAGNNNETMGCLPPGYIIAAGAHFYLALDELAAAGSYDVSTLTVTYTDYAGLTKTVKTTCTGTITTQ
jgi:hypothetical protein